MVGLKEAKDQIERFIATARMNRLIGRESLGGNHLLFLGNARTIRNAADETYQRHAQNYMNAPEPHALRVITAEDIAIGFQNNNNVLKSNWEKEGRYFYSIPVIFRYRDCANPSVMPLIKSVAIKILRYTK